MKKTKIGKMKKIRLGIIITASLFLVVPLLSVIAQSSPPIAPPPSSPPSAQISPPANSPVSLPAASPSPSSASVQNSVHSTVSILDPQADLSADGKTVDVKFTAKNVSSNYYSNLIWEFIIFRGGFVKVDPTLTNQTIKTTNSVLLDDAMGNESFNLAPQEEKSFSFQYDIDKLILPQGSDYSFKIKVVSRSNSEEYGNWLKPGISLGSDSQTVQYLYFNNVQLMYNGNQIPNLAGVNVNPGEPLEAVFTVNNASEQTMKIRANIKTFSRLETLNQINDEYTAWQEVPNTKPPKEPVKISVKIPNKPGIKPESYLSQVRFYNEAGKQFIPSFDFRWVVIGATGNIIDATSTKDFYKKGESVDLKVKATGPADLVTKANLTATASFFNENSKKTTEFSKQNEFGPTDDSKMFDFSDQKYPKSEVLSKIVVELKDGSKVLDSREIVFEKHSAGAMSLQRNKMLKLLLVILLILAITVIIVILYKKKFRATNPLLILFVISFSLLLCKPALAWTYLNGQCAIGCGGNTCYTGFDVNPAPWLAKINDTIFQEASRMWTDKCFNAVDWDIHVAYSYCTDAVNNSRVVQLISQGDEATNGSYEGPCPANPWWDPNHDNGDGTYGAWTMWPCDGSWKSMYHDEVKWTDLGATYRQVQYYEMIAYCQADYGRNVTIPGYSYVDNSASCCTPVNGGWSGWSSESSCGSYVACMQRQTRTCTNPAPSCGGANCAGAATQDVPCGAVNCGWGAWYNVGACGAFSDCQQLQYRDCNNPPASCGGTSLASQAQYVPAPSPIIADPVLSPPSCNVAGNGVTLSWTGPADATSYYFRSDYTPNNNPICSGGWLCSDPPDKYIDFYGSNSYSYAITPDSQYNWWVHSINSCRCYSPGVVASFSCPSSKNLTVLKPGEIGRAHV
jgi:hypothetical protein